MNLLVLFAVVAALVVLRFLKANSLAWMAGWWIGLYIVFKYGVDPPLPASIVGMFMFISTISLLAYLTAGSDRLASVKSNLVNFMVKKKYATPLIVVLVLLPLLVAFQVYRGATQAPQLPISGRTIHPPPPAEINAFGKSFDLATAKNPYRELEETDHASFAAHVENGRRVYYQNCVYCHGDNMAGDGIFSHGLNPIPANFQDPTTIAMLQESYLFWRITTGGPGLPSEATPWLSAMPAWELFLSEEEVWDVILFLYEFSGQRPRSTEEEH